MRRLLCMIALGCLLVGSAQARTWDPASDHGGGVVQSGTPGDRSAIPALTSFVAAGPALTDIWCTGLGFNEGIFWVCGGDFDGDQTNGSGDNGVYFYDETGAYLGGFPQPTQDTWGWRDSGTDGTHLLFGASAPHNGTIFYVNATTLAVEIEFAGCPFDQCRALAVEADLGGVLQYKVSDYGQQIETWIWQVGTPAGMMVSSCPNPSAVTYGMAFDSGNGSIWMTTSSAGNEGLLYQLDPATCSTQNTYDMNPESPRFGGAVMALTSHGCNLWTLCQCPDTDMVFGWQTGGSNPFVCDATPVESTTWGSIKARYDD